MNSYFSIKQNQLSNILYLMLVFLSLSSLANYLNNRIEFTYLYLISFILTLCILIIKRKESNIEKAKNYTLALLYIIFFSFLFLGEQATFDIFWVLVLPMLVVMLETYEKTKSWLYLWLGTLGEYRSNETGAHVIRVGLYSKKLALLYGLNSETADQIYLTAPLHDIGKVGIEDSILNKPGKLTSEEFDIMKAHAKIGEAILAKSKKPLIQMACEIAGSHHEKYDGSGYPRGIIGKMIPLSARIVAIADVFDALSSKRVYKPAWTKQEIIDFFKDNSGKHFDPELISLLLENIEDFFKIYEDNQ